MYEVKITTKYNVIELIVEDLNSPEVQEIFNQPYVLEIKAKQVKEMDPKIKRLKKEG